MRKNFCETIVYQIDKYTFFKPPRVYMDISKIIAYSIQPKVLKLHDPGKLRGGHGPPGPTINVLSRRWLYLFENFKASSIWTSKAKSVAVI